MEIRQNEIAVIFEVLPANGQKQEYLDIATKPVSELEKSRGLFPLKGFKAFISLIRFCHCPFGKMRKR